MADSIAVPYGLETINPLPEIKRYYNKAGTPYINTAQVFSEVPQEVRYKGQYFLVVDTEWEFSGGILDSNLKVKTRETAHTSSSTIDFTGTTANVKENSLEYKYLQKGQPLVFIGNPENTTGNLKEITLENAKILLEVPSIVDIESQIEKATTFTTDFAYNLSPGKSLGFLVGSGTYPAVGKTQEQFLREIAFEYIAPSFTSFNIQSEPTVVEVGTTLTGTRTFKWTIDLKSGIVPTIDIYDNNTSTTLVNTPNNGTKAQAVNTIQLDSNNATQSWRGIAINTTGANVNSSNFTVTALFNRYWGSVSTLPASSTNGTANRTYANALENKAFKTNGANTFTLNTGVVNNKFIVLLPPGITITSVVDTGNLNLNITSSYILSTITVKDAGGTDRIYNQYLFNPAGAYPTSTNHVITTN